MTFVVVLSVNNNSDEVVICDYKIRGFGVLVLKLLVLLKLSHKERHKVNTKVGLTLVVDSSHPKLIQSAKSF